MFGPPFSLQVVLLPLRVVLPPLRVVFFRRPLEYDPPFSNGFYLVYGHGSTTRNERSTTRSGGSTTRSGGSTTRSEKAKIGIHVPMQAGDKSAGINGAPDRIRTDDTRFRRAVLYPLSYQGKQPAIIHSTTACGQRCGFRRAANHSRGGWRRSGGGGYRGWHAAGGPQRASRPYVPMRVRTTARKEAPYGIA